MSSDPRAPVSHEPSAPHYARLERWATGFVFAGAAMVYLSLWLRSLPVFIVGESVCVGLAPVVIWFEREEIRSWWRHRGHCPVCDYDLRGIKGLCPGCGYRRLGE